MSKIETNVPVWQRSIVILSGAVVGLIVIAVLQLGRPVLMPIAMAVVLTFLVNPVVKALYRRGLHRIVAVLLSVVLAGAVLLCLGWVITSQISSMLAELPQNTAKIKAKLRALKQLGSGRTQEQIGQMIEEISTELNTSAAAERPEPKYQLSGDGRIDVDPHTDTIIVRSDASHWLSLTNFAGSALEVLATLAFVLVLLVFFLIEREDLRDRIVLLAGKAKLALTSKAVEDITDRISRYIGMVALINGGFGLILAVGLFFFGVPYAMLWGFIAAIFRFIPYVGPWIGAVFPITMSLATADGWGQPLSVLAFVGGVELVTNNAVEPFLFGHTTGVSPTALLVSAAFWLYLWGPIGLVLSAPFAVCLVVLGKNIPELSFLYLLLGDKPALNVDYSIYQRLMLGDCHEATALALKRLNDTDPEEIYDEMLIPVLTYTKRDVLRDYLTEDEQLAVLDGMKAILQKIDSVQNPGQGADDSGEFSSPCTILSCPAADEIDMLSLEMLRQLLDPHRWKLEVRSPETLASELVMLVTESPPAVVFIASLSPGGLSHAKYLCKRLRSASVEIPIVVGRFGPNRNIEFDETELEKSGADFVMKSLVESRNWLTARLPILVGGR